MKIAKESFPLAEKFFSSCYFGTSVRKAAVPDSVAKVLPMFATQACRSEPLNIGIDSKAYNLASVFSSMP